MSQQEKLVMEFDPNTIEHLGIQMYSTLPPVIAELVANSYDAEAKEVTIYLYDNAENKRIVIKDSGHGMSFDEINTRFLKIGKNRRKAEANPQNSIQKSDNDKRYVIGRKGLGKLSFFGIAEEAQITTIKNGLKTVFKMDIDEIRSSIDRSYEPEIVEKETSTDEPNGTTIELLKIKRKTSYVPENLALSLSRGFEIFDEPDFDVFIVHNNDEDNKIEVTNSLKYETLQTELEWNLPNNNFQFDYEFANQIKGRIISVKQGETVPSEMRGIALFSRKKLVNKHDFYGSVASSTGYTYLTGWLSVDFIETFARDVISTNRQSLNWELEETEELKDFLQQTIKKVYNEQREFRKEEKLKEVKSKLGFDLEEWLKRIPSTNERKLAKRLITSIVENEQISAEKGGEFIEFIKDSFQFEAFKELARDIDAADIQQTDKIIDLFKEWKIIEAREFQKIARIRIETIKKFEEHIEVNAREVPTLHRFFKKFPWILDPRIMDFEDEKTFSKLLREAFPEEDIEVEEEKRIDFLCLNFTDTYFIIELKRPNSVVSAKELDQCLLYRTFLTRRLENLFGKNVVCYLIGGSIAKSDMAQEKAETYAQTNRVYFKSYRSLLEQAIKYHQEFIDRYENLNPDG
jgi:hypothetical protein